MFFIILPRPRFRSLKSELAEVDNDKSNVIFGLVQGFEVDFPLHFKVSPYFIGSYHNYLLRKPSRDIMLQSMVPLLLYNKRLNALH